MNNIIIEAKSNYGKKHVSNHGDSYSFIKIVERVFRNGNFLVMLKSNKDNAKILVNIEHDKDLIVKFN